MDMARGASSRRRDNAHLVLDDEAGGLTGSLTRYDRNSEKSPCHTRIKSPAANIRSRPGFLHFAILLLGSVYPAVRR